MPEQSKKTTVGELIDYLQNFQPDLPVLLNGEDGGYEDVHLPSTELVRAVRDYRKSNYMGPHEDLVFLTCLNKGLEAKAETHLLLNPDKTPRKPV